MADKHDVEQTGMEAEFDLRPITVRVWMEHLAILTDPEIAHEEKVMHWADLFSQTVTRCSALDGAPLSDPNTYLDANEFDVFEPLMDAFGEAIEARRKKARTPSTTA